MYINNNNNSSNNKTIIILYCYVDSLVIGLQQSFSILVNCLSGLQRKTASVSNCFILLISPYGQQRYDVNPADACCCYFEGKLKRVFA